MKPPRTSLPDCPRRKLPLSLRICAWAGGIVLGILLLVVGALTAVTYWLTPDRLSRLIAEQAPRYLNAEIRVENPRFTFWSSFPRFRLETDSIAIHSLAFEKAPKGELTEEVRQSLPRDADLLLTASGFSGAINVRDLLRNRIRLHDVELAGLGLNLVAATTRLANWDILFPDATPPKQMPVISANRIRLVKPRQVLYRSLPSGMTGRLDLREVTVERIESIGKLPFLYRTILAGRLWLAGPRMTILSGFPFALEGDIALGFRPLRVSFSDYRLQLGNIDAAVSMDLNGRTDNPSINSLSLEVGSFRLLDLLGYLPEAFFPGLGGIEGDLRVRASARLTAPWSLSSPYMPSVELTASMPDDNITYPLADGGKVTARHVGLRATLYFDGRDPAASTLNVPRFRLEGEDVSLDLSLHATDILAEPKVDSELDFSGNLNALRQLFPALAAMHAAGDFKGDAEISLVLAQQGPEYLRDLKARVNLDLPDFQIDTEPGRSNLAIRSGRLAVRASGSAGANGLTLDSALKVDARIGKAEWKRGNTTLTADDLKLAASARLLKAGGVPFDSLQANLASGTFTMEAPANKLGVRSLETSILFRRPTEAERKALRPLAEPTYADSAMLATRPHTPEALRGGFSKGMASFVSNWRMAVGLRLDGGRWDMDSYPHPFTIGKADLRTDFDSLVINRLEAATGVSSATLSGSVSGLRRLFAFEGVSPLRGELRADCGTVDINQIARACHDARAGEAVAKGDQSAPTPAWLIPRNLDADVVANASKVLYTNLELDSLRTSLHLHSGDLDIPALTMTTGFGSAAIKASYHSSSLGALNVGLGLALDSIDLQPCFAKFKSLEKMMPTLRNLSGHMWVGGDVSLDIFPDMTVDMPSLTASLSLEGRGLELKQDPFVHHLTRMLLIRGDAPIRIADLKARATVGDNLLEIHPFLLGIDRYRLEVVGVNNFAGDLDYHIGVMRSPVPFRFGINIEGMYHKPHLRFGGYRWKPNKTREVMSRIAPSFQWNFTRKMQWAGRVFMNKAATGQTL